MPLDITPEAGESVVYLVEVDQAAVIDAGKRVARYFDVDQNKGQTSSGVYTWQRKESDPTSPAVSANPDAGVVMFNRRGAGNYSTDEIFTLDPEMVKAKGQQLVRELGFDLTGFEFSANTRAADEAGYWGAQGNKILDGNRVGDDVFLASVLFGKDYEVAAMNVRVSTLTPIGVSKRLSLTEALGQDKLHSNLPSKGEPTREMMSLDTLDGRWILIPGWSLPLLPGVSEGISTPAISNGEISRLLEVAKDVPRMEQHLSTATTK